MSGRLPHTVVLRRWRSVHELDADTRMIGLDPSAALVVGDLAPGLADLLDDLRTPVRTSDFIARAAACGVAVADARTLLEALHDTGELVDAAIERRTQAHRATAAVVVHGTGPLTVGITAGLAVAGIGAVHLTTHGTVTGADFGTGLSEADRGLPRAAAIAAATARAVPGASVTPWPRTLVPDLVVLADEYPDPVHVGDLLVTGIPHLPVRMRDGVGVVGPLVLPGRTACLHCLDLQRSAFEPSWPFVAAQLAGRRGGADPASVAATAALAIAQVVGAVDATAGHLPPPAVLEASLEIDVAAAAVLRRGWQAVPGCHCRAADRVRAEPGAGVTIDG